MSRVQDIEEAIAKLSAEDLADLRAWFAEFDANVWDRQIEADAAAGKLNPLLDEARRARDAGRSTEM